MHELLGIMVAFLLAGGMDREKQKTDQLAPQPIKTITGYYATSGKDDRDKEYGGFVKVSPVGKFYRVEWAFTGQQIIGCGILEGDVLSVGWHMVVQVPQGEATMSGIHRMQFSGDNASGGWGTMPGSGNKLVEKWEFVRPLK